MQNIINFDVRGDYACSCVANIFNGAETINLFFEADEYIKPQLEVIATITTSETTTTTTTVYDLEVVNGFAVFNLDHTKFTSCQLKYIDGTKSGTTFYFTKSGTTYSISQTMRVDKIASDKFKISFVAKYKRDINSYSDDFEVDEDGTLTVKSPTKIKVTETDDLVSNVTLVYSETDERSYSCKYDENGKLTQFGSLPITWNEV